MIRITVDNEVPELMDKVQAAVSRFVRKGILHIEGEVKSSIAEPKSGRSYKRGKDKTHVASAPGESPASDSSNYIGSIQPLFESSLEAKVGTPLEYPVYLEDGTDTIEKRPLWEKTVEEGLPTLETLLKSELKKL